MGVSGDLRRRITGFVYNYFLGNNQCPDRLLEIGDLEISFIVKETEEIKGCKITGLIVQENKF